MARVGRVAVVKEEAKEAEATAAAMVGMAATLCTCHR